MLRMITYGDGSYGSGMNTLLNSAASPKERCVSKFIAIANGTDESQMQAFEANNPLQSFPDSRLIPVWPIQQSQVPVVCTPPYDSRTVDLPAAGGSNRDSYIAGYNYTVEGAPSWLTWQRMDKGNISSLPGSNYDWDKGIQFTAEALPSGTTSRSAVVIINAVKNTDSSDSGYFGNLSNFCDTVCSRSRLTVVQGDRNSANIAEYTGIDKLDIGFGVSSDITNTRINTAVVLEQQQTSGTYFANGTQYGVQVSQLYNQLIQVNGSQVSINIAGIKQQFSGTNGNVTFDIYSTWEGSGDSLDIIPVPFRSWSWSVDLIPNSQLVNKKSISVDSCGNMNIGVQDIDTVSNTVDKMRARCSHIAVVTYNTINDTTTITQGQLGGIRPKFYPSSLSVGGTVIQNAFVWSSSGSSINRSFNAISVPNGVLTIGVTSKDYQTDLPYKVYMSDNTSASSYTVNSQSITSGDEVTVSAGNTFTIDLSNSTLYPSGSTHRFYLRQYQQISTDTVSSGNVSPEYAYIQFTIQ